MTAHSAALVVDAVILAGGTARRMGGVDKPALTVGRVSLVQKAIDAASNSRHTVVVGPHRPELATSIVQTRETPVGSGPVAAIAAGLSALPDRDADFVVVLAADLPLVDEQSIRMLLARLHSAPAVFAQDATGRAQYLLGAWRGESLRRAIDSLPQAADVSVRSIVPHDHTLIELPNAIDCDTPSELARARESAAASSPTTPPPSAHGARESIRRRISPLIPRTVAASDALDATLSTAVVAAQPLPPVDISAMDGYAVRGPGPWRARVDVAYAGTSGLTELVPGEAVRIATGARVPPGATSVVRDEHVLRDGDRVERRVDTPVRDDTRVAGEDWSAGTELVTAGTRVSPAVVSVALSGEVGELTVRGPVSARIIISGNEIRREGRLESGQTRDSIGPVLPRYVAECGMTVLDTTALDDSPTAFDDLLAMPTPANVLIVVGATGGGAADRLRTALIHIDADIVVHRTRVRPGGSQIVAVLPNGTVLIGLPGNPLAAVSTLMLTAPAVVDALTARTPRPPILGYLADDAYTGAPIDRIVPVTHDGSQWRVEREIRTAHLLNLVDHDALALIPAHLTPGTPVELLLLPR